MSLKWRVLAGFIAVSAAGFYFLADSIIDELRPRYLEAVEESLNDTVQLLASFMEGHVRNGRPDTGPLERVFSEAGKRRFSARIYGFQKTRMGLDAYVTDARGVVLYDSRGRGYAGRDLSRWNDVYLTLQGRYGARSTRTREDDPSSSILYVAAPIRHRGAVVGVVTVIKPQDSVTPFIDLAKSRLVAAGIAVCAVIALTALVLSFWISRPLTRLTEYVRSLKRDENARLPRLSGREIAVLGREFESLWTELKGRKYIEEYVQSLTHELKSPVTSIRGSAELLGEEMPADQRRLFLVNIVRETKRIEDVIQKMLELSSLENRKSLDRVEDIPLMGLAREAADALSPSIIKKNLAVDIRVEADAAVRGERFLLGHAIVNLLENAVRFSPENGTITLSAEKREGGMAITIADKGPGIPDYALGKVFGRFYSLPDPATGKKGTGLGLTFVREAASLHGGRVDIRNNPEGGVSATLFLP